MINTKLSDRNPYSDAAPARKEHDYAVKLLTETFTTVERIGRKQIYLIDGKFYILIKSAPSDLQLKPLITGTIKLIPKVTKLPMYIWFTREPQTWPKSSSYVSQLRSVYTHRKGTRSVPKQFMGYILGMNDMNDNTISSISNGIKLPFNTKRFEGVNGSVTLNDIISEFGITKKKFEDLLEALKMVKLDI